MEDENAYEVIITHEGLIFVINCRSQAPERPFILYDGGCYATLYRRENETILLDKFDKKVIEMLQCSDKVTVFELSSEIEDIARDYEVYIKHIKKLLTPADM